MDPLLVGRADLLLWRQAAKEGRIKPSPLYNIAAWLKAPKATQKPRDGIGSQPHTCSLCRYLKNQGPIPKVTTAAVTVWSSPLHT